MGNYQEKSGRTVGWRKVSGRVLEGEQVAVKKANRKVNREGQRWTDYRPGMTLRLPIDLREAITEESRVKGDLARIVLFALDHVYREKVEIMQTRKVRVELSNPQLLHVGAKARLVLKEWAEADGVCVIAICSILKRLYEMRRRAKSGIFTTSRTTPKAIAAVNSQATIARDNGAMAIP